VAGTTALAPAALTVASVLGFASPASASPLSEQFALDAQAGSFIYGSPTSGPDLFAIAAYVASTEAAAVEAPATVDTTGPTSFYGYKYDPNYEAPVEAITVDAPVEVITVAPTTTTAPVTTTVAPTTTTAAPATTAPVTTTTAPQPAPETTTSTVEPTVEPLAIPETASLEAGISWTEVETPHEDQRAQNNLEIYGTAYTVDNSPTALGYIDWVEAVIMPTAPRWAQEIWPTVRVIGADTLEAPKKGSMYGWFSNNYPALLQINVTAANGEPVNRDPYGELHVVTIHELAHACDFNTACSFGTVNPYDLLEPFSQTSAWQTAVDRHELLGSDLPADLEIVAEIVTFHTTGQAIASYLNPSVWYPETTEEYYGLADVRDAAYDTAYTNWTAYKAGGSKQDYQATYGTYQAAADAVQAYWDTVKGTQAAHELDLCQDITEVLVAAGVDNSYGTCE